MAETPDISRAPRRIVPPTVVDVAPTVVDLSATSPVLSGRDIPFRGDGDRDFVLHTARIVGAGGQGTVVEATDEQGAVYAAKLAWQPHSVRDRQARRQVLGYLRSLMTDHPLGANHYRRTHLMPLFAVGQVTDCLPELGETTYDVAVMPLCEGSYADRAVVSFRELRDTVNPPRGRGAASAARAGHRPPRREAEEPLPPGRLGGAGGFRHLVGAGRGARHVGHAG